MQNHQLVCFQSQTGECASAIVGKLNFKYIWSQNLDDSSDLSAAKLTVGQILRQRHNVEKRDSLVHFHPLPLTTLLSHPKT